ncbi:hypothetical protein IKE72_02325 [Candidatus Saccharibacteria bacterium]|nr:hypothetical protein [Candidatus Saccharibacteria bacterium]
MDIITNKSSSPARAGGVGPKFPTVRIATMSTGKMKISSGSSAACPSIKASDLDFTAAAFTQYRFAIFREM